MEELALASKHRKLGIIQTAMCGLTRSIQYYVIPTSMSWDDARSYCRENHTDLASVADMSQANELQKVALGNPFGIRTGVWWIGLFDDLSTWSWSSFDNSYPRETGPEYRNWMLGQPDNMSSLQMCARMGMDGFWDDADCLLRNPFICYSEQTSSPYIYIGQEMSWGDAQKYCRDRFTDLVWIKDSNENSKISNLAAYQDVWIGLYRRRVWSDGTESNFVHWRNGQPDNIEGTQCCTAMDPNDNGLWSDKNCILEFPFICYGPDEHVISLDINLTSTKQLTDAELSDLVSNEFRILLIKLGLSENMKMALKGTKLNGTHSKGNDLEMENTQDDS